MPLKKNVSPKVLSSAHLINGFLPFHLLINSFIVNKINLNKVQQNKTYLLALAALIFSSDQFFSNMRSLNSAVSVNRNANTSSFRSLHFFIITINRKTHRKNNCDTTLPEPTLTFRGCCFSVAFAVIFSIATQILRSLLMKKEKANYPVKRGDSTQAKCK